MHVVNFAIVISTSILLTIIFTVVSNLDAERISLWYNILQLNDNVYVHLMNLDSTYVTLVLLGLEDEATSLLLGDQSQRFKNLCMSGLHKIWSKVSRYTR